MNTAFQNNKGMKVAFSTFDILFEPGQVKLVVLIGSKTLNTIVGALHNMMGCAGQNNTGFTGHGYLP